MFAYGFLLPATVVRDPIHGMIPLSAAEWAAVDSRVFQRLRSVRQLAMTYLVYPGAVHSRFEHSIGVRHVAGRLAEKLRIRGDELRVVCAAALLHDVGHGVFSHVSEQVIDERSRVDGVHEAVSVFVMRNDQDLRRALGGEICDRAADVVALRGPRTAMSDIVSGPTDADKLDYLLRDSYFAGVNYGRYDLGRIIDSARIITPRSRQSQLGFDADGMWAVEELLMARHHMHRQVYGHKTRLATDIMVTRALRLAVEEGILPERAFRVDFSEERGERVATVTEDFLAPYLEQTDARTLAALAAAPDGSAVADLADRLISRRLLRQSVTIRLDERTDELGDAVYADILDPEVFTRARVSEIEEQIADELNIAPHLVAVYLDARANPTYRNPGAPRRKDIMLQRDGRQPRLLQKESEIFRDEKREEHAWIHLYTPNLDQDAESRAGDLLWNALQDR
jgi:HD superfamily phosphohydrolase